MQINTPMKIKRDRRIKRELRRSERKGLKIGSKIQIGRDICKDMYLERGKYRNIEKKNKQAELWRVSGKNTKTYSQKCRINCRYRGRLSHKTDTEYGMINKQCCVERHSEW